MASLFIRRLGFAALGMLVLFLVLRPDQAEAASYYVAPSGGSNFNPGTVQQPFASIQRAADVVVAGDTIFLRGGTHVISDSTGVHLTRDGNSATARIKLFNFPGETPVLDAISQPGTGNPLPSIIRMTSASWWHIKGLELKNGSIEGLEVMGTSSNNIFELLNIHDIGREADGGGTGTGLKIGGNGANNLVLNNDIHENEDARGTGGGGNGLNVVTTGAGGNVVRGNRMWCNSDDGLDTWVGVPVLIENNWIWKSGFGHGCGATNGDGNGYKLGGNITGDGGHTVRNNLSWGNRAHGFTDNLSDRPLTMYNNTSWNNAGLEFTILNAVPHVLKNNLAFGTVGMKPNTQHTFNSWNFSPAPNAADFASLTDTCASGPRKANGDLPDCPFLRLVASSDLIDKGQNVGLPFSGSAPDLGAFEFLVGDSATPVANMTAPAPNSTVSGTAVTVSATATDNVGVVGVQFKLDGVNLGAEDTALPYSITWDTTTASNSGHTLTAVARDAAGNIDTSPPIAVTVNNITVGSGFILGEQTGALNDTPPADVIEARAFTLSQSGTIRTMTVQANTAAGTVRMGIYDDDGTAGDPGTLLAQTAGASVTAGPHTQAIVAPVLLNPGTYYLAFVTNGSAVIKATATGATRKKDNNAYGPLTNPFVVSATVTNSFRWAVYASFTNDQDTTAPEVSITAPAPGNVSGSAVSITADASDEVGVAGVQFKLDGSVNIGAEDTTSTYGVTWDTSDVSNGTHTLTAVARDADGNTTVSAGVAVTVNNTLGTPSGLSLIREEP